MPLFSLPHPSVRQEGCAPLLGSFARSVHVAMRLHRAVGQGCQVPGLAKKSVQFLP